MDLASVGRWLGEKDRQAQETLRYYLGPAYAPIGDLATVMGALSPGADLMDAAQSSQDLMRSKSPTEALQNAGWLAASMAGMALPGTARGIGQAAEGAKNLASRVTSLYNLPTNSEVGNALGRSGSGGLDLEGRPLVAKYVVGRTPDRTVEQSLPSEAVAEIVARLTGGPIERVAASRISGGDSGVTRVNKHSRMPTGVFARNDLTPSQFDNVARHEAGHVIDQIAGEIPIEGLSAELKPLYSYGVEGKDKTKNLSLPQHWGYKGADIPREYLAEALRQYMSAPDALKERAPKTAAAIRKHVNANPNLRELIQFNALLAGTGIGGAMLSQTGNTQEQQQ